MLHQYQSGVDPQSIQSVSPLIYSRMAQFGAKQYKVNILDMQLQR